MYAVNSHVIKIDRINEVGDKLIDVLQFHGVFAYFQISRRYLTNFKISGGYLVFHSKKLIYILMVVPSVSVKKR
jgi:hypothetical protein